MINFNCAGVSPIPFSLFLESLKFLGHYYYKGPRSALLKYESYIPMLSQEVAKLLNCDAEEVCYIKNTSEGIVVAAESIPFQQGDEILVMRCEYPANLIPWLKKKDDGVQVTVIEGADSKESFENLKAAITDKTRVIALSWIQFSDGYMNDLAPLSRLCQEKGIILVVDAVQMVGTRSIDLKNIHIDILMSGGHKHLKAFVGSGFLYVNKNLLPTLKRFKVGIRSVKSFDSNGFQLKDHSGRFEDGTPNILGIVALYHQIKAINKVGVQEMERRTLHLSNFYKKVLRENGIDFVDHKEHGNMISIPVKDPAGLMKYLEENRILVRNVNGKFVRISYTDANPKSDIYGFIKHFNKFHQIPAPSLLSRWFAASRQT